MMVVLFLINIFFLYPNNLKNWNFGCAKTPGLTDHKRPHISNIGSFMIDQSREFSRQPKSNSSGCLGITYWILSGETLKMEETYILKIYRGTPGNQYWEEFELPLRQSENVI